MALRSFMIPIAFSAEPEAELNAFLASHRILAVDRRFVDMGPNSATARVSSYSANARVCRF